VATAGRRGELAKTVNVVSNDPKSPNYLLTVKGKLEVIAGFEPDRLNLGQVKMGDTRELEARLAGSKAELLRQGELVSSNPDILKVVRNGEDPLKLKITFSAPQKEGPFSGQIKMKTGIEAVPEIMLMIFGQITGDIVSDRQFIYLSPLAGSAGLAGALADLASGASSDRVFRLRLRSLSEKPFQVTRIEDPDGVVVGQVKNRGSEAEVVLVALRQPPNPNGLVRLHTDRAEQPALEIRYLVRSLAGGAVNPGLPGGQRPLMRPMPQLNRIPERMQVKQIEMPPSQK